MAEYEIEEIEEHTPWVGLGTLAVLLWAGAWWLAR